MQQVLMCEPTFFDVQYVINPWMNNNIGTVNQSKAFTQWSELVTTLEKLDCEILLVPPVNGLPDMVFTANAGLAFLDGKTVMVSNFKKSERQPETLQFTNWFKDNNFTTIDYNFDFEGAGDALFDSQGRLWIGYGFRTDEQFPEWMTSYCGNVYPLQLINPSFYHLDTAFCPLENGYVLYNEKAFDLLSNDLIKSTFGDKAISVAEEDAKNFACNAVNIENHVVLNSASDQLIRKLADCGFTTIQVPMSEFMKSGGSCKCLTLKLY